MKKRELEKIIDEAFERHHESEAEVKLTPALLREMIEEVLVEAPAKKKKGCSFPSNIKIGNIAEGIFAAAQAAKIWNPRKVITEKDVWGIVDKLKKQPARGAGTVGRWETEFQPWQGKKNKLIVNVEIQSEPEYNVLTRTGKLPGSNDDASIKRCFAVHVQNSLDEVNGESFTKFALRLYGIPKKLMQEKEATAPSREKPLGSGGHRIEVSGVGMSEAGDITADVQVIVDGIPLRMLSPSLKAASEQVDQWSGRTFEDQKVWYQKVMGIDIPGNEDDYKRLMLKALEDVQDPSALSSEPAQTQAANIRKIGLDLIDEAAGVIMKRVAPLIQQKLADDSVGYITGVLTKAITKLDNVINGFPIIIDVQKGMKLDTSKLAKALEHYTVTATLEIEEGKRNRMEFYAIPNPDAPRRFNKQGDEIKLEKLHLFNIRSVPKTTSRKKKGKKTGMLGLRPNNYFDIKGGLKELIGRTDKPYTYDKEEEEELVGKLGRREQPPRAQQDPRKDGDPLPLPEQK